MIPVKVVMDVRTVKAKYSINITRVSPPVTANYTVPALFLVCRTNQEMKNKKSILDMLLYLI